MFKHLRSTAIVVALLMMVLVACGANTSTGASTPTTAASTPTSSTPKLSLSELNLGVIPSENATKVLADTLPFADALSKQLGGIKVNVIVGTNYTATIEAMASKKIDVAWFGPFSYVLASDKYNAEVIARQLGSNGSDQYYSYIITTPKTGIKTLADLKGHSFSFVDPASTSGNLVPRYVMTKAGLNPDTDVQGTYAGGHDVSLLGVLSGKTDAGAVASDVYASLLAAGKFKDGDLVIVNKSDPIPNSPIAVRKELSASDKAIIKAAFLNIKDAAALKSVNSGGFEDTTDATYDGLRDIAKTLKLDLTKLK